MTIYCCLYEPIKPHPPIPYLASIYFTSLFQFSKLFIVYVYTRSLDFVCVFTSVIKGSAMQRNLMHRQIANLRKSLFDQGYLDEQFVQLEELQDNSNPNFVEEVVTLFYRNSARFLYSIDQALEKRPIDFSNLDNLMHQFKSSSTSIGAKKVKTECTHFRSHCNARNAEGCKRTFQQVKKEYTTLKKKLETYFQMSRQAGPIEVACRPR